MIYIILTLLLIIADQISKYIVRGTLSGGAVVRVIDNIIELAYVENRGAAFGLFQNTRLILIFLTVIILAVLLWYIIKSKKHPLLMTAGALIFAGGVGNLIDRVFIGYVTDFIHTLFIDFPCFNIADICVCVGGALLIVYLLFIGVKGEKNE